MTSPDGQGSRRDDGPGGVVPLLIAAPLAGAVVGAIGACFRWTLDAADGWRLAAVSAVKPFDVPGLILVVIVCAGAAALAAWLVRRFSREASGSGIPHVEAVLDGEVAPAPLRLIPVKFIGGVLAIGSGLALGREGPSVQMGATAAHQLGRLFRLGAEDCRMLLAAGAGAGLATAFNAPIAGAIFVLEELVRRFETRIAIAALGASATAIAVSRSLLGGGLDFPIPPLTSSADWSLLLYAALGGASGLLAITYNRSILGALAIVDRFSFVAAEWRAAGVGAVVGLLAFFAPAIVGGGDPLTQAALLGHESLALLPLLFLVRFLLGAASYAAGTPGGLFAPMLTLGSQLGLAFGLAATALIPGLPMDPRGFALVGMAAFFAGVVRAPLTGIALVIEMTGDTGMLLPVLAGCFIAMLVPTWLGNPPIYDSLKERTLRDTAALRTPSPPAA